MTEVSVNTRSTFTWERVDGVMVVTDLDDGTLQLVPCSVTNDAENVIKYLYKFAGLKSDERVVYCDTQGRWDELMHQNGKFAGFAAIGCRSKEVAILTVRQTESLPVMPGGETDPWG